MSVSYIPESVKLRLWGKAGGRCQYTGCNQPLYRDSLTKAEFNVAYIAHIVADQEDGPRGDPVLSPLLAKDIINLMILCDAHHRLVDIAEVERHTVEVLRGMKQRHEQRIELLTSIDEDRESEVLLYWAKIGEHNPCIDRKAAVAAMVPELFPASAWPIELGRDNSSLTDGEEDFWKAEIQHLRRQFKLRVEPLVDGGKIKHFSIFGLAPMPLLMELGKLVSDLPAAQVFECHREPPGWKWQPLNGPFSFSLIPPDPAAQSLKRVALVLSLSAQIIHSRVHQVLGTNVAIWEITHLQPKPGFLKAKEQLIEFRETMRLAFNRIKAMHGQDAELHVFPAVPAAAAVEVGRVWMKKADLPFRVYDQNNGAFVHVHDIQRIP